MSDHQYTELVRLVNRYCDHALDEVEVTQLQKLLRQDPEGRRLFHEIVSVHADVHWLNRRSSPPAKTEVATTQEPPRDEQPTELARSPQNPVVLRLQQAANILTQPLCWAMVAGACLTYGTFLVHLATLRASQIVRGGDQSRAIEQEASPSPVHPVLVARQSQDLLISEAYVNAVTQSQPIAYWRFEELFDERYVRNELSDDWPLRMCGKAELGGPWGYRRAIFADDGEQRWMQVDKPVTALQEDYSLELLIKPDRVQFSAPISVIVPPGDANLSQFYKEAAPKKLSRFQSFATVELMPAEHRVYTPSAFRFLHRDPPGIEGGSNVCSSDHYRVGRWQHVVATKKGRSISFYLDGQCQHQVDAKYGNSAISINPLIVVGRLFGENMNIADQEHRQVIGQLDEVAVYARALGAEEIQTHYQLSIAQIDDTSIVNAKGTRLVRP